MQNLAVIIWLVAVTLLVIFDTKNLNKFEDYLVKYYRDEFNSDAILLHGGRASKGMVRPKILLGLYNPHPNDKKFNHFVAMERLFSLTIVILLLLPVVVHLIIRF